VGFRLSATRRVDLYKPPPAPSRDELMNGSAILRSRRLLALFPTLEQTGGIQKSAWIAWEALSSATGKHESDAWALCYCGSRRTRAADVRIFHAISKGAAARAALVFRPRVQTVLVWHADLLKLVPLLRQQSARVVLYLHGIEAWRRQDWLTRMLLRRVGLFLANSAHTWTRFVASNPEFAYGKHAIVPLGLGTPMPAGWRIQPDRTPAALMLGRLSRSERYKGYHEMIDAWPLVLKTLPEAQLWIAGDGDLRTALQEFARTRGVVDRVQLWGFVSEEQKQDLLTRSHCLALPSRKEGFGLVYLEAMRLGRPCLVSTEDAGREVVCPPLAGLAASATDREALAAATIRLLTDGEEWACWATVARRRYEENFTAAHFQDQLLSALRTAS
jgi:glycosyltransferase involved in cell wall biosynthesis